MRNYIVKKYEQSLYLNCELGFERVGRKKTLADSFISSMVYLIDKNIHQNIAILSKSIKQLIAQLLAHLIR